MYSTWGQYSAHHGNKNNKGVPKRHDDLLLIYRRINTSTYTTTEMTPQNLTGRCVDFGPDDSLLNNWVTGMHITWSRNTHLVYYFFVLPMQNIPP